MRIVPTAVLLLLVAVVAFMVNAVGAMGGHCGDDGCSASFPEWLYIASGWLVLACLAGLLGVLVFGAARRIARRSR